MKKTIVSLFATLLMSTSSFAHDAIVPAWLCDLKFKGHAQGFQVILGKFSAKATGTLRCVSLFSEVKEIPVSVDLSTKYIAPRIAIGSFDLYGQSLAIALLANEPEDLLGRYLVAQGQGAIIAGAGVMTAVHASIPDVSLNVSVQFVRGLGLNIGLTDMKIKAIE